MDTAFIHLDDVDSLLEKPMEDVLQAKRTLDERRYIEDIIKELHWWACFEQERQQEADRPQVRKADLSHFGLFQPVVKANKVGRNEPCPCGSGKKYKKYCGA